MRDPPVSLSICCSDSTSPEPLRIGQQARGLDAKGSGQFQQVAETDVAFPPLDPADVRAVKTATPRKLLLREARSLA
jgi:hypothetical protein